MPSYSGILIVGINEVAHEKNGNKRPHKEDRWTDTDSFTEDAIASDDHDTTSDANPLTRDLSKLFVSELNVCWKKIGHYNMKCRWDTDSNGMQSNNYFGEESSIVEAETTSQSPNVVKYNATYRASVEDIAVQYCFFDILLTSLSPRNCITPEVLWRVSMHSACSTSENALEKPLDIRKLNNSSYQALGACFKPYKAFLKR
ncbi:SNF1-related protein kinase catalytic subunit alpha KIN10-like protein [Tanacetum coccineum]